MAIQKRQDSEADQCYQLWSGVDYTDLLNNSSEVSGAYKRNSSESSAVSTSPESSSSSVDNERAFHVKELPSTRAYGSYNNFKLFMATKQSSKLAVCCSFCKNNGEPQEVYTAHSMKNAKGKVTCPLLRIYECPVCGLSGDEAHTITYCKKNKLAKRNEMLNSLKQ